MQTNKIGCLVMAAGNSSRFGANKLDAEFGGLPLIERTLQAIPAGLFSAITVVTQYDQIERLAAAYGFACRRNCHPELGISHTISLGIRAMQDCDAILFTVSDQPLLSQATILKIVSAWKDNPSFIYGAAYQGKRGNPSLFPKAFFPELLALAGDCGGSRVIKAHPERFRPIEVSSLELTDCDTPQALAALKEELKKGT